MSIFVGQKSRRAGLDPLLRISQAETAVFLCGGWGAGMNPCLGSFISFWPNSVSCTCGTVGLASLLAVSWGLTFLQLPAFLLAFSMGPLSKNNKSSSSHTSNLSDTSYSTFSALRGSCDYIGPLK